MTPCPGIQVVCCLAVNDEKVLHSTSLLQGNRVTLICSTMWGSLVTRCPVIRVLCCLAVNDEKVLDATSLLQGKRVALI